MNGRVKSRYEIGHHLEGLIAFERTRAEAFETAFRWGQSDRTGYPDALRQVRVWDSMARVGQPTTWAYDTERRQWRVIKLRIY